MAVGYPISATLGGVIKRAVSLDIIQLQHFLSLSTMATCTDTQIAPSVSIDAIELAPLPQPTTSFQRKLGTADPESIDEAIPPVNAVDALQKWNSPGGNMWRVFAAF